MATDMFLKLGDIKGESNDQAHRDEIEISSWGWGMKQSGSMHSGTGGGAGKVNIRNLSITKTLDKSTPNLMMACSTGNIIPKPGWWFVKRAVPAPWSTWSLRSRKSW